MPWRCRKVPRKYQNAASTAKDTGRGVPQGAPISPLLATLCLRRFVLGWKKWGLKTRFGAKIRQRRAATGDRRTKAGRIRAAKNLDMGTITFRSRERKRSANGPATRFGTIYGEGQKSRPDPPDQPFLVLIRYWPTSPEKVASPLALDERTVPAHVIVGKRARFG